VSCKTISANAAKVYSSIQVVLNDWSPCKNTLCYIHDLHFSQIRHFRPMTQPNPLKRQISDPLPNQPSPTHPAGQPNPRTTVLCVKALGGSVLSGASVSPNVFRIDLICSYLYMQNHIYEC